MLAFVTAESKPTSSITGGTWAEGDLRKLSQFSIAAE